MINPITNDRRVRKARQAVAIVTPETLGSRDGDLLQAGIITLMNDLLHLATVKGLDTAAIAKAFRAQVKASQAA